MKREESSEFLSGIQVAVDPTEIDRELAALWKPASEKEGGRGAVVRACRANLIAFLPESRESGYVHHLLSEVSRDFPNRTILLHVASGARPDDSPATRSRLRAWVTANCTVRGSGAATVCCEQITLEAAPQDVGHFAGAVAPLLVPDIPVYLWWSAGLDHPLLEDLADDVDRIIVNFRRDLHGTGSLARLERLVGRPRFGEVVDLGWRGLIRWREAVAAAFDEAPLLRLVPRLSRLEAEWAAPDGSSDAPVDETALLLGWVASRLQLQLEGVTPEAGGYQIAFRAPDGREISGRLSPRTDRLPDTLLPGEPVSLRLEARDVAQGEGSHVRIAIHEKAPETARVSFHTQESCRLPRVVPFRRPGPGELLRDILLSGARTRSFQEALRLALPIVKAIEASAPAARRRPGGET